MISILGDIYYMHNYRCMCKSVHTSLCNVYLRLKRRVEMSGFLCSCLLKKVTNHNKL